MAELWQCSRSEYFADTRLSNSKIGLFIDDRRAFVEQVILGHRSPPPSDEMIGGDYTHTLVLEPDEAPRRFTIAPRRSDIDPELFGTRDGEKLVNRTTKAGKAAWAEFVAGVGDRRIVMPEQATAAGRMMRALRESPDSHAMLWGPDGRNEVSLLWDDEETGRPLKCRFDRLLLDERLIVELKTDRDVDPTRANNQWRWYELGYHRKAAMYLDAAWSVFRENFALQFIFVENTREQPRVMMCRLDADDPAVELGRQEYRRALREIEACESTDDWREEWEHGLQRYPIPDAALMRAGFGGGVTLTQGGEPMAGLEAIG